MTHVPPIALTQPRFPSHGLPMVIVVEGLRVFILLSYEFLPTEKDYFLALLIACLIYTP
jgi:hypothetical protein